MFEFYPASSCDPVPLKVLCVLLDFLVPIPMSCMRSAILFLLKEIRKIWKEFGA
jgi:hypothetical protein